MSDLSAFDGSDSFLHDRKLRWSNVDGTTTKLMREKLAENVKEKEMLKSEVTSLTEELNSALKRRANKT